MPGTREKAAAALALLLIAGCRPVAPEGREVVDCGALVGRADIGRILPRDCAAELEQVVPAGGLAERELPTSTRAAQRNLDRALAEASDLLGLMRAEVRDLCEEFNRCGVPEAEYRARREAVGTAARAIRQLGEKALADFGPQAAASRQALEAYLAREASAFGGGGRRTAGTCPPHWPVDCHDGSCAPAGATCCGNGLSCPASTLCCGTACCPPDATCRPDGTCEGGSFALGCTGGFPSTCPDGSCAPAGADCCGGGTFCRSGTCCGSVCCGEGESCAAPGRCVAGAAVAAAGGCDDPSLPVECPDGTCAPTGAHCCGNGKICRAGTCCGDEECCQSGQACVEGRCVGPVAASPDCAGDTPVTCPDASCAPVEASCCGNGKFCPDGLACCGETECCMFGEVCAAGRCVAGGGGAAPPPGGPCTGEYAYTCPDGTCAPPGADCCDNGKFCRTGACCGEEECCQGAETCVGGRCVGPDGAAPSRPCDASAPQRCPDGSCAPLGAACCGNGKYCTRGTCCGDEDCCQGGEICVGGACVKGGDA